jgi:6-phosphogluconate dehydrogenase
MIDIERLKAFESLDPADDLDAVILFHGGNPEYLKRRMLATSTVENADIGPISGGSSGGSSGAPSGGSSGLSKNPVLSCPVPEDVISTSSAGRRADTAIQ